MAFFVINAEGREICRRELSRAIVVGRSPQCDVCLTDRSLSRAHCRFEPRGKTWYVVDQTSKNGTFVDGAAVRAHALNDGAVIQIGACRIVFRSSPPAARAPASSPAKSHDSTFDGDIDSGQFGSSYNDGSSLCGAVATATRPRLSTRSKALDQDWIAETSRRTLATSRRRSVTANDDHLEAGLPFLIFELGGMAPTLTAQEITLVERARRRRRLVIAAGILSTLVLAALAAGLWSTLRHWI